MIKPSRAFPILAALAMLAPAAAAQLPLLELAAQDGAVGDSFGSAVAIDGVLAVVGAPWDDDHGASSGSAYVFERGPAGWVQVAKLVASDAEAGDELGRAVALSGDTVLVGAWRENEGGADAGAAYVFERSGGVWAETAKLTASDASAGDRFGVAVAISGARLIAGASGHDFVGSDTGGAYVFERSAGGTWGPHETAFLRAVDAQGGDLFGSAVSIDGERALVGAPFEHAVGSDTGSAYVFERGPGGSWSQTAKLHASDAMSYDLFGSAVSLDGGRALIGAPGDDNHGVDSGSAYVFQLDGSGAWTERERLLASEGGAEDQLGVSVALRGAVAVVGALYAGIESSPPGAAYLYLQGPSGDFGPREAERLVAPSPGPGQRFGAAVALSSSGVLVGEPGGNGAAQSSGLAHAREVHLLAAASERPRSDCGFELLTASDGVEGDVLGATLALGSGVALVGATNAGPAGPNSGAVYVYQRDALGAFGPQETAKLVASDAEHDDRFGGSIALWGTTALIGADGGDGEVINSGAVYVFERGPDGWAETVKLFAPGGELWDAFGGSVALEDDTAMIGAHGADDQRGAIHVFERGAGGWTETQVLTPSDPAPGLSFGRVISLSGATLWVGVAGDGEQGHLAGAAYVFTRTPDGWFETAKLFAGDPGDEAFFGRAVAADGDRAIVGAMRVDGDRGAAYVFERGPGGWHQTAKLQPGDVHPGDRFGEAVALAGGRALVGSRYADGVTMETGAAWLFARGPSSWTVERVLAAPDGVTGDSFGSPLALTATTALVGAAWNDDHGQNAGSAYVFHPVDGTVVSTCRTSPNSVGFGATIGASGSTSIAVNELALFATGAVPDQPCVFFYGPQAAELPFGNGFRCVGAGAAGLATLRPPLRTDAAGAVVRHLNLDQPPADSGPFEIRPGSTWYFQLVYRDPFAAPTDFDLSDALRVSFCP